MTHKSKMALYDEEVNGARFLLEETEDLYTQLEALITVRNSEAGGRSSLR